MSNSIVIAVDAMGGDNSPNKIINGISEYTKKKMMFFSEFSGKKTL